ncbi:hypothetical protein HYDPIDRAFT_108290 [Hydnomerulius pinastri MD-312]|nr:hypothetical protein HYDPIDRAFT_108290 [Hydnomerulius pinastri MD-312]
MNQELTMNTCSAVLLARASSEGRLSRVSATTRSYILQLPRARRAIPRHETLATPHRRILSGKLANSDATLMIHLHSWQEVLGVLGGIWFLYIRSA